MSLTMFTLTRRLVLSSLAVMALAACSPEKPKFNGIDITGADYANGFTLTDHNGQSRSLHPMPRCVPHIDGRAGRSQTLARRGW